MPVYEYRCRKCGKTFERVETLSEHLKRKPSCPACKSRSVSQVLGGFTAMTSKKS